MFIVKFEIEEQQKTGQKKRGLLGENEETKSVWVKKVGSVVGFTGSSGSTVLLAAFNDGEYASICMDVSKDENGVMSNGIMLSDGEWHDIKDLKIVRE
jgi:hypothetical protein